MKNKLLFTLGVILSISALNELKGQTIPVAAEFLNIPINIRGAGMGNLGVANGGDANAVFTNPALVPFNDSNQNSETSSISVTFSPIASQLSKNIKLLSANGYLWANEGEFIGLSLQYLTLGDVHFYDEQANETQFIIPNETAIGAFYSRRFSDNFGLGITLKGIFSNLTGGVEFQGEQTKAGFALATDIGVYGRATVNFDDQLSYGLAITNMGTKISYSELQEKSFLPMALRFGAGYKYNFNENYFRFGLEFTKMLIPSTPIYDENNNIIKGKEPDMSVPGALFGSFGDHPNGLAGELKEYGVSTGIELGFSDSFFLRTGYYYEAKQMGFGSFASIGLGFKKEISSKKLGIDIAYLIPSSQNLALKSSFKIGLFLSLFE